MGNAAPAKTATPPKTVQTKSPISITVVGIKGEVKSNVLSRLDIKKNLITPTQPKIVRWRFFKSIPKEVKQAIQPYGFFKPTVTTQLKQLPNKWQIKVNVQPGRRMKFTSVKVIINGAGKTDRAFKAYLADLPIQPGDNFNSQKYESIKDRLQNIANARGYFQAKIVESKLKINLSDYTSTAKIIYDSGIRYRFGKTIFEASKLRESLLRRYLRYSPMEYYKNHLIEQTRLDLTNSNYFQQVVMTPQINQAVNYVVPIKVKLFPQDQVIYSLGAGYGTDTGIRGLASMDLRWLNSYGHSFKALARGSQLNSELAGTYTIPGFKPARDFFSITGGLVRLDQTTGKGKNAQLGANYQILVNDWRI